MAPESTSGRDDAIENMPPDSDTPRGGEGGTASLSRDGSMMSSTPQLGDGDASPSDGWSDVAFASLGQAAAASGFGIVVASLAVATERRTGSAVVGTVALAVEMWSRAAVSLPAAARANARGRREVIAQAGCIGVLGSLVSFADFYVDSHVLYFLGLALVGVANCVAQQLRFAAAEAVKPGDRPRALSFGVAGGTLAAFIGPEVAKATRTSLDKEFAGCFLAMAACYAALVAFTVCIKSAGPRRGVKEEKGAAFTWPHAEFARSAKARKGLAGVTCAWTAMFLAMSAAPLAMTGDKRRRALVRRRRHRAATSHGHDVPAGAPGNWGWREEVRAGCGVHRRVRAVPGVRRVYVRGCAREVHRVGTSMGVLCFVDTVGAGVELHVHRGICAHVTRRSGAGRGRLEAGAGCRGGCDVRGGGRGVGGFGGASRRHRLAGALRVE